MSSPSYFDQISEVMELEPPKAILAQSLHNSMIHFSRMTSLRDDHGMLPTPVEDAYLLTVERWDLPEVNIWLDGRHHSKHPMKAGRCSFVDLNVPTILEMNIKFDSVEMHFPRAALNAIANELGTREIAALSLQGLMGSTEDAVIRNLADCLLPAFEHPERANQLFVDHIAMAILAHMAQTYGGAAPPKLTKGGLAPWQVRLAKEVVETRLDGKIGLEDLARECGLSRSHFARAFKKSTGKPPHRWLMEQRLGRARELLLKSKLSLAEISDACGFADQSHFTRCFFAATGTVPSEWRRLRRE